MTAPVARFIWPEPTFLRGLDGQWRRIQEVPLKGISMEKLPITHVIMIVDKSGSMAHLAEDVRGGFNQFVEDLRDKAGRFRLSVTLFDTECQTLCIAAKLRDAPRLTEVNYQPGGFTALLDAVGKTVYEFEQKTTIAKDERVLVVVQTDGQENASQEYRVEQIRDLITAREASDTWSFLFLGAGPKTWAQAGSMGFATANTVSTQHTNSGTRSTYRGVTQAAGAYASGASGPEASKIVAAAAPDNTWHGDTDTDE